MTLPVHSAAIAFRQGQVDALARTLFASPALYPAEMRECFALRSLQRTWDQYREDRAILTGASVIGAECAAQRDAFLSLLASILPKPRGDLGQAIAVNGQRTLHPTPHANSPDRQNSLHRRYFLTPFNIRAAALDDGASLRP